MVNKFLLSLSTTSKETKEQNKRDMTDKNGIEH